MQQSPPPVHRDASSIRAESAVATLPVATERHYSLARDLYRGAFLGDFAATIGIPGAVTQALLGYVPVVGTITALRDAVADWRLHDVAGIFLNILAAFPVLGGLAKTADVLHAVHRLHRAYSTRQTSQQDDLVVNRQRSHGCLAFFISLVVLSLGVLYGLGIHIAAEYARASWPFHANTLVIGNGVLVVAVGLAALGLSIGEVTCAGSRAWFGVIFLPAAMFVGLLLGGGV
jgi:hypothetical protein